MLTMLRAHARRFVVNGRQYRALQQALARMMGLSPNPRRQAGFAADDLSFDEIKRAARAAFGEQAAYIGVRGGAAEPFEYGVFLDGLANTPVDAEGHPIPPDHRPIKIVATGATWREARRKLELAIGRRVPS